MNRHPDWPRRWRIVYTAVGAMNGWLSFYRHRSVVFAFLALFVLGFFGVWRVETLGRRNSEAIEQINVLRARRIKDVVASDRHLCGEIAELKGELIAILVSSRERSQALTRNLGHIEHDLRMESSPDARALVTIIAFLRGNPAATASAVAVLQEKQRKTAASCKIPTVTRGGNP